MAETVDSLATLASLVGRTVVSAAVTDVWELAMRGIVRLFGRGDPDRGQLAERRLQQTREQLAGAPGMGLEQTRAQLEAAWTTRVIDLLGLGNAARTRSSPIGSSAALIATAVCEALWGSTPIITAAIGTPLFADCRQDRGGHA